VIGQILGERLPDMLEIPLVVYLVDDLLHELMQVPLDVGILHSSPPVIENARRCSRKVELVVEASARRGRRQGPEPTLSKTTVYLGDQEIASTEMIAAMLPLLHSKNTK
jgi:hypothetical protein